MKIKLSIALLIMCSLSLFAQNQYWSHEFKGNHFLNFSPYAGIQSDELTTVAYTPAGRRLEITGHGKLIENTFFPEVPPLNSVFFVSEDEDIAVLGHSFKFNADIRFNVYDRKDQTVLYKFNPMLSSQSEEGYPLGLKVGTQEYLLFGKEEIVRMRVTAEAYTELARFSNPSSVQGACLLGDVVYTVDQKGLVRSITGNELSAPFFDHSGTLNDIYPLADALILVGSTNLKNTLTKIDLSGKVIFSRFYNQVSTESVFVTKDDKIIFTGEGKDKTGFVSKTDANGKLEWTYEEITQPGVRIIQGAFDGIYVLALRSENVDQNITLLKLGPNGESGPAIDEQFLFPLEVNNIKAFVDKKGNVFTDDFRDPGYFYTSGDSTTKTIANSGCWMGGYDGDTLRFGSYYDNEYGDFQMGPFGSDYSFFSRIWSVSRDAIDEFRQDQSDGKQNIDWELDIVQWPARGNTIHNDRGDSYLIEDDLAPFIDINNNDIYEPYLGDYPDIKGDQMLWWVYNDCGIHWGSGGAEIGVEVKASLFAFACENQVLNTNSTFLDFQIENVMNHSIKDFNLAYWVNGNLGCSKDDYLGSLPNANSGYFYNANSFDGEDCMLDDQMDFFENEIPIQAITILNRPLEVFTYFNNYTLGVPHLQGTSSPGPAIEYMNYFNSLWRDGTLLTYDSTGYDTASTNTTNFAFPGNPADDSEWSLCSVDLPANDRSMIMKTSEDDFGPGDIINFQLAFTTFENIPHPCPDVTLIESALRELQEQVDAGGLDYRLDLGLDTIRTSDEIYTIDAGADATSYLWSNGSTDQTIDVVNSGMYSVTVTTPFFCELSDEVFVDFEMSNNPVEDFEFNITPNPTTDLININLISRGKLRNFSVDLISVDGRFLHGWSTPELFGVEKIVFETKQLLPAVYFIQCRSGANVWTERVVVF